MSKFPVEIWHGRLKIFIVSFWSLFDENPGPIKYACVSSDAPTLSHSAFEVQGQ